MSIKSHWEKIYKEKSPQEVSWTQEIPSTSITFFNEFNLNKTSPIIDVGGGESKFVDYLIDKGYEDVSVLDISENAINRTQDRLGEKAKNVNWIISDINDFIPHKKYALWHDRAVFHFLTSKNEIKRYTENVMLNTENLISDNIESLDDGIKAIFNGPFTLPIMRRNEVMMKINYNGSS